MDAPVIALVFVPLVHLGGAQGQCNSDAQSGPIFHVSAECTTHPGSGGTSSNTPDPYEDYKWSLICSLVSPDQEPGHGPCQPSAKCADGERLYVLLGLKEGRWLPIRDECRSDAEATPTVTPALVSTAFQRIPLPHLRAIAQPGTKTLVNFDTIFHVQAEPLQRHLTLLNQRVELDITPSSFHWTWGDGETDTTHTPGAPYPDKTVTHRYLDADTTVSARVTVTWTARWRVNGGTWADVPGSVQTTGPAATLRVVEAVPNLSGPD